MISVTKQDVPRIAEKLYPLIEAYRSATMNAISWRFQMDSWDRQELSRIEYRTKDEFVALEGERITEPSMTYLMRDDQFEDFCKLRDEHIRSLNVPGLDPNYCPALVAENKAMQCEQAIVDAAEEFFGVSRNLLLCAGLEKYKEYVTMLCAMVLAYRRSRP